MCDFVTFCPNCGFNIKSFRKKTRDQQMGDYFRKMYSHAPKNDEGFAKSENDEADVFTASQDIAAFPKSSGYPAVNNDTVQYGDGFLLSSANAANKKKMSRKSRFFLLVTLIILLPCLAAVLIFSMVISQNKEDDVKAQRASRLSLSRENNQTVTIEPGVIRYVDNDSVRCTFKSNTDDHIFAVVNNGHNTITTFRIDYEKRCIYMHNKPKDVDQPNCMVFQKIKRQPDVIEDVPEKVAEARAAELIKK